MSEPLYHFETLEHDFNLYDDCIKVTSKHFFSGDTVEHTIPISSIVSIHYRPMKGIQFRTHAHRSHTFKFGDGNVSKELLAENSETGRKIRDYVEERILERA